MANQTPHKLPQSPPQNAVPGKPIVSKFPTPNLADRIFVVRKDSRVSGNPLPKPGDKFDGPNPSRLEGFVFATSVPSDQAGWQDWYYLNERANQDDYNYEIDYPYVDHDYPRYTRTYVLLRKDLVEPTSDDVDPVFNPTITPGGLNMVLTDHKQLRVKDDPVIDSLFVGVQRVYERLPGPVLTSYGQNEAQQIVTLHTQETLPGVGDPPTSDAVTESIKVEGETLAKQKVTIGKVPDVFPKSVFTKNWGSTYRDPVPLEYRFQNPLKTTSQVTAGTAVMPNLNHGDISAMQTQVTEFKKETVITHQDVIHTEVLDQKLTEEYGGGKINIQKSLDPGAQSLDEGYTVTASSVRTLGDGATEKITEILVDEVWPTLHGFKTETDGIYAGIVINYAKTFVPEGTVNPGGFTDMETHDKWRSIQIVSAVDLTTLPGPETYATTTDKLRIPATLKEVRANWNNIGGSSQTADDNNHNTASVEVSAGAFGGIAVLYSLGHVGPVRALVTRYFFDHPPSAAELTALGAIPTSILPASGTATLIGKHVEFKKARGTGYASDFNHGEMRAETHVFEHFLTGSYIATNATFNSASSTASASSGVNSASLFLAGPVCSMIVDVQASTPAAINSGDVILVDAPVTKWRFNIYVLEIIKAIVP